MLYLVKRAYGRCERVVVYSIINHLLALFHSRIHNKIFYARRSVYENCQLLGKSACNRGLEAHSVGNYGDLHTGLLGKVGNRAVVKHVSIEDKGLSVAYTCVENVGGIFIALFDVDIFGEIIVILLLRILASCGTQIQRICVLTRIPPRAVGTIFFNKVWTLSEPLIVLRVMTA